MSAILKIRKVNVLPVVLTANTLYFLRDTNNRLSIHLTDSTGQIAYTTYDEAAIGSISTDIITSMINQPNGIAGLDANGNLLGNVIAAFDGQNGNIKHNNEYVWDDLMDVISYRNISGGNNPTWGVLWNNHQGLIFSGTVMNQVFSTYHFKHDIALNTPIFIHTHFCPLDNASGIVRFGFEYNISKGHGQEAFSLTDGVVYAELNVPANSARRNYVAEIPNPGILSASIEPDANMKVRVFRDAANDSYNGDIHMWQVDLHYQKARLGTKNRLPDFFS